MRFSLNLSQNILPLSEFRANMASVFDELKKSNNISVITQNGKAAAVVMSVKSFEKLSSANPEISTSGEPATLYYPDTMNPELHQKLNNLSPEELQRLEALIDTVIKPAGISKDLPALNLGGKLDDADIRALAREE